MANLLLSYQLALITSVLLLIFALFLFNRRKKKNASGILLALFLLSNALYLLNFIRPLLRDLTGTDWIWLPAIGFASGYLFGPLMYMFTRSISTRDYVFSRGQGWHFLPFVLMLAMLSGGTGIPWQLQYTLLNIQIFSYLIISIRVIMRYHEQIKDHFSFTGKVSLTWLLYVVGGFMIMWLLDIADILLRAFGAGTEALSNQLTFFSIGINFIFALLIFYKALQQPRFILDLKNLKYEGSRLSTEEKEKYLEQLKSYFEHEKPYLSPSVTIKDISAGTGIPSRDISQVINESLKQNFYDFINSYRIGEAKKSLLESGSTRTVLEILYEVGFNSKSAFNTAFKKQTGLTPSKFKETHI